MFTNSHSICTLGKGGVQPQEGVRRVPVCSYPGILACPTTPERLSSPRPAISSAPLWTSRARRRYGLRMLRAESRA